MNGLTLRALLLLALTSPLAAQQSTVPDGAQVPSLPFVFHSGASVVSLNVTVTDGKHFVGGLGVDDFAVYEDNVRQRVQFFEARDVPLDLILLLDTSASMSDKIDIVHEAALGFLKTLRPIDRGAVVAFSDGVDVLQPLSADRASLEAAIKRTQVRGGTALNNAIYVALKQFGRPALDGTDARRQVIAVLTDGYDTASVISFEDVLALARKSDVNIYTIGVQSKQADPQRPTDSTRRFLGPADYSLKTLAEETGAQAFFPEIVQDLKGIYAAIAEELSNQYSLGYTSSDLATDGRFRRIVVKVPSRPELHLRSRMGYTAESKRSATIRYR